MASSAPLARLATPEGYRRYFMDAALWRPFVHGICAARGWPCQQVRPGRTGTFPTFAVDEQRVVKFFGPLFDGGTCLPVERETAGRMAAAPEVPIARLLADGTLEQDPRWGYLVFEYIPGKSLSEVYDQVSREDKLKLAGQVGSWTKRMHQIPLPGGTALPHLDRARMQGWFAARWKAGQELWPRHLAAGVRDYLDANAEFLQTSGSHFIHADLTQDHLLGQFIGGHWQTRAVIDFGDAMLGNLYYELAALHLDLFDCDKRLLTAFLESYGLEYDRDFPCKAMTTTLLHQFDVYGHLFAWKPELQEAGTVQALAEQLWQLDL